MYNKDEFNLKAILEAIEKIENFISDFKNANELYHSVRDFDAVMMNFVVIGEMTERLSTGLRNKNKNIDWSKIKSFRNIIAHDYFGIDAEEVWQIIRNNLPEFKKQVDNLLK
jgi:uncharacterized protein with HEPN domain